MGSMYKTNFEEKAENINNNITIVTDIIRVMDFSFTMVLNFLLRSKIIKTNQGKPKSGAKTR
jgi:hypothetical protein